MRRGLPLSFLATLASVFLLGTGLASAGQDHRPPVVGHVYVNDNTARSTRSPPSTATPTGR